MSARGKKLQVLGWTLFIVCSFFYMASSIRNDDMIGLGGGIFFFLACLVFLVPILAGKPFRDDE